LVLLAIAKKNAKEARAVAMLKKEKGLAQGLARKSASVENAARVLALRLLKV
jgi:hypothetical protein